MTLPNHFSVHNGVLLGVRFGDVERVIPVALPVPHVRVQFAGGAIADLSEGTVVRLFAALPAALAALPIVPGTLAGHTWEATE